MTTPIPSALQSLFAKRGFAWSDEIAGRQLPAPTDATRRVDVLDDVAAPITEIDVSTSDDPSSLFTAISPLGDNERQRLFQNLEQAEYDLIDALLAAYNPETWASSKLRESVASDDEVDWDTLAEFRDDGRGTRAILSRQLAEAVERDEWAPPDALRSARALLVIRARLFRDSVRIAISMAKARAHDLDWVLALSTACMGILVAIDRFEPSRGYQFSTYAMWWVRHRVGRMRSDDARPLRIPVHMTERLTRFLRAERALWARLGRAAAAAEVTAVAKDHGLRPSQVSLVVRLALAARVGPGGDAERIIDPEIRSPAQGGLPDGWVPRFEPIFDAWLAFAAARSDRVRGEEIVRARFGIGRSGKTTLRVLAESFRLSRERVRQIQEQARDVLARFNLISKRALEREPWTWRLPPDE